MTVDVKICGLNDPGGVAAAVAGGASFLGFVFFPRSPRHVTPEQAAGLMAKIPPGIKAVGVFVDPSDEDLAAILAVADLDVLQLHGGETVERAAAVRAKFGKPVIKALAVSDAGDLDGAQDYEAVADYLMFDAKPPKNLDNSLPGGNGLVFDWRLLAGRSWSLPWFLSGGLTPDNVAKAVAISGARLVDVSSGVENAPGRKDIGKIAAFLAAAKR